MAPFHYEFLVLDRYLGRYEHTLAFLQLLNTIFNRHVPGDEFGGSRVAQVIAYCIMLLPPVEGDNGLFRSPSDRWKLYSEVLRIIETVLRTLFDTMRSGPEDWLKHPSRPLFEQVLHWVVQPESQAQGGLRSRMMDLLALGLQIAGQQARRAWDSALRAGMHVLSRVGAGRGGARADLTFGVCAEESLDESELPHLAGALEVALRVVHLAIFVCSSQEEYRQVKGMPVCVQQQHQPLRARSVCLLDLVPSLHQIHVGRRYR